MLLGRLPARPLGPGSTPTLRRPTRGPQPSKYTPAARPPRLTKQRRSKPQTAQDRRDNGILELDRVAGVGNLETQAAVNDAQDDGDTSVPQVQVRDEHAALRQLELAVVKVA